jgi:hypothetical protein
LLVCEPQDLLEQVRADPFIVVGQPTPDGGLPGLGLVLHEVIGSLSGAERTLMERVPTVRASI